MRGSLSSAASGDTGSADVTGSVSVAGSESVAGSAVVAESMSVADSVEELSDEASASESKPMSGDVADVSPEGVPEGGEEGGVAVGAVAVDVPEDASRRGVSAAAV